MNKRNRLEKRIEKSKTTLLKNKLTHTEKNGVLFFGVSLEMADIFLIRCSNLFKKIGLVNDADTDEIYFDEEVV